MPEIAKDYTTDKRKKVRKAIKAALLSLLALVLLVLVAAMSVLLFDKYVKKSVVPSVFGYAPLFVSTGSMSGTIEIGDLIIVKKTKDVGLTDIVTYVGEGDSVSTTHRLINYADETHDLFYAKGDANHAQDVKPVSRDQIFGKVVCVIPHAGLFFSWVSVGGGWIFLLSLAVIIPGGVYLYRRIGGNRKE